MTIAIKILDRNDVDILKNVDPDVFDNSIDIPRTEEFLTDSRHHLAVAIEDDRVVGFVSAVHYVHPDKARPELWINEVSVAETHRRQGLGKRLMNAVFEVARELGCTEAWVLTDRENTAAMKLYSAVGNPETPSDHVMFTFRLEESNS
jgi:ribosomal protein S18 acetylase RimI-like enzyme